MKATSRLAAAAICSTEKSVRCSGDGTAHPIPASNPPLPDLLQTCLLQILALREPVDPRRRLAVRAAGVGDAHECSPHLLRLRRASGSHEARKGIFCVSRGDVATRTCRRVARCSGGGSGSGVPWLLLTQGPALEYNEPDVGADGHRRDDQRGGRIGALSAHSIPVRAADDLGMAAHVLFYSPPAVRYRCRV